MQEAANKAKKKEKMGEINREPVIHLVITGKASSYHMQGFR